LYLFLTAADVFAKLTEVAGNLLLSHLQPGLRAPARLD